MLLHERGGIVMAIALTLQEYLKECDIDYDVVEHDPTMSSIDAAEAAHIPGDQLAKSVILKDDQDYLMAVVPSTCHVKLHHLERELDRNLGLVDEEELSTIFNDCEVGAIPPIGQAYFIDMIVDKSLMDKGDIYFEAGDHKSLVHMSGDSFKKLIRDSKTSDFTTNI